MTFQAATGAYWYFSLFFLINVIVFEVYKNIFSKQKPKNQQGPPETNENQPAKNKLIGAVSECYVSSMEITRPCMSRDLSIAASMLL